MAITSAPYKPSFLSPAYNPIVWSVMSNNVALPYFKYVFDIYVDGTKVNQIKQRPNPAGYGMIDVSTILQGLIDFNNSKAPVACGETSIDWANHKIYADNASLSKHVMIKVGEEYQQYPPNGTIDIHSGVAFDVIGPPAYPLYAETETAYQADMPVQVWPASIENREQILHMQRTTSAGVFGIYNPNKYPNGDLYEGSSIDYTYTDVPSHPLCFAGLNQSVSYYDKLILSYFTRNMQGTSYDNGVIYGFRFVFKDSTGTTLTTKDVPLITANGFSMRANCATVLTHAPDSDYDIVHLTACPLELKEALSIDDEDMPSVGGTITITGYTHASGVCSFTTPVTRPVVITIIDDEECNIYDKVRLSWMNTLGGRDYMNFTVLTEKTITATQDSYSQEQLNWSSSTPVEPLGATLSNNTFVKGGSKPYNKNIVTSYRIQTNWLTQDQVNLLEGLVASSQVLAYFQPLGHASNISFDYPYSCNVTQTSYTTKNIKQTKMIQAEFIIALAMPQKIATT